MKNNGLDCILTYLPAGISDVLRKIPPETKDKLSEIRIRVNRPISIISSSESLFLCSDGSITKRISENNFLIPAINDVEEILRLLSHYSLHSCKRELQQGYFTISGGIRVGLSGSRSNSGTIIKYVNGYNFRIAREIIGCAEEIYNRLFSAAPHSVLICGGVNSGKTTILRDLCRLCGKKHKVTLVDERNELSSAINGIPCFDIGLQTDLLEGYNRDEGINSAIRTLSPKFIVCDEISNELDTSAILNGFGCGVRFIASIHAESIDDIRKGRFISKVIDAGIFDYGVFLHGEQFPGKVREIRRLN